MNPSLNELSRNALRKHGELAKTLTRAEQLSTAQEGELIAKELIEQTSQLADATIRLAKFHRRDAGEKRQPSLFNQEGA